MGGSNAFLRQAHEQWSPGRRIHTHFRQLSESLRFYNAIHSGTGKKAICTDRFDLVWVNNAVQSDGQQWGTCTCTCAHTQRQTVGGLPQQCSPVSLIARGHTQHTQHTQTYLRGSASTMQSSWVGGKGGSLVVEKLAS